MSITAKVFVTIGILIGFILFFGVLMGIRKQSGATSGGIIGFVLFGGMIAGIRAVWKKSNKDKDDDHHQLDKTR